MSPDFARALLESQMLLLFFFFLEGSVTVMYGVLKQKLNDQTLDPANKQCERASYSPLLDLCFVIYKMTSKVPLWP